MPIDYMFGIPAYKSVISAEEYNKEEIVQTIEKNFYKDRGRNNWDSEDHIYHSDMHHAFADFDNENFEVPDFSQLMNIYERETANFLGSLSWNKRPAFEIQLINYTCTDRGQFMREHNHASDFSAVHYIKFNPESHSGTQYVNIGKHSPYIKSFIPPSLNDLLDSGDITNSWQQKYWSFSLQEDDLVITPGLTDHFIAPHDSDGDLRMTIVFNINVFPSQ